MREFEDSFQTAARESLQATSGVLNTLYSFGHWPVAPMDGSLGRGLAERSDGDFYLPRYMGAPAVVQHKRAVLTIHKVIAALIRSRTSD
jgi:hypothetical protein